MSQPTLAGGATEVLRYSGVTLEAITPSSVGSVSGLDLQVGPRTLSMSNATTGVSQSVPYEQVTDVHCGERGTMSDGSLAVVMSAVVAGRPLRWLIPIGQLSLTQAMGLESVLRQRVAAAAPPWLSPATSTVGPPGAAPASVGSPSLAAGAPLRGNVPTTAPGLPARAPTAVSPSAVSPSAALPAPSIAPPTSPPPPPAPVLAPPIQALPPPPTQAFLPPPPTQALPPPPTQAFLPPPPGLVGASQPVVGPPTASPWWTTLPQNRVPRRPRSTAPRRLGRLFTALVVAEVALVIAAIVLPIAADHSGGARPPISGAQFSDRDLARQLNLQQSDLPSSWTVDNSSSGPLSGFLTPGGGTGAPTPQDQKLANQVATQFEQCMGITASDDRIFGSAGSKPSAAASSPAFASPSGAPDEEAASSVDVFASRAMVAADVAQISKSQFPSCFGAALGTSFVGAATATPSAGQVGQPTVQAVTLPQRAGIVAAGVDVTIPVTRQGATVPIQFGVVLVGGGRAEATLYTFSEPDAFPASLATSLSNALSSNIVSESGGTAT